MTTPLLHAITPYEGRQDRAWEELTYQLRPVAPDDVVDTRKTHAPDGGVEWYWVFADGHHEGYQAKFYRNLSSAIGDMRTSVEAVCTKRPEMTRLTFVVPFDFTDQGSSGRKSDQSRWDEAIGRWNATIPRASAVEFHIVRGGDVLQELARDRHVGRRAFWFQEFELTPAWLDRRWREARQIVDERYTPAAHTHVSVEKLVSAVSLDETFQAELNDLIDGVERAHRAARPMHVAGTTSIPAVLEQLRAQRDRLWASHPNFDPVDLVQVVALGIVELNSLLAGTGPGGVAPVWPRPAEAALRALVGLRDFLGSNAVRSARSASLAVVGSAGQGKTHTVLDRARWLLNKGVPSFVLLGQRFTSGPWWGSVRDQLGGVAASAEAFLGAFNAMCEARGVRGVIFVDALNESQDPASWSAELRSLLSYVSEQPFVSIVVTWRTDYVDLINPPAELPTATHAGLAGLESDALAAYCKLFKIDVPASSLFDSAFASPLFLRMFCEIRAKDPSAGVGATGRSQIFSSFARIRAKEISKKLNLDPSSRAVDAAVELLADQLIGNGGRPVERAGIESKINALVPSKTQWPDTLFGAMRSAGLVETSPSWQRGETASFPFQAFSEHLVVSRLLTSHDSGLSDAVVERLREVPALWRSAAVIVPELFGEELADVLGASTHSLDRATLTSLADREPAAFGARAFELLAIAMLDPLQVSDCLDVILSIAPRQGHPANASWLHERLRLQSMPDRDASWGVATYDVLDRSSAYQRLASWAGSKDDRSSDEQVALASIPLVWMLSTPNRFLRDRTTKILVELFRFRLSALAKMLTAFDSVDDPYVKERLLTLSYGAIMRGGDGDKEGAHQVMREVLRWFESDSVPIDTLARDSGRGAISWGVSRGLVTEVEAETARPPYGSLPPNEPPSAEDLESSYGLIDSDPRQWRAYSILSSCLDWMGDFNKYVIKGDVDTFTLYPLAGPGPSSPERGDARAEVDGDWAGRWVAHRAIELGWTAERFEKFERDGIATRGREGHKPERFGKKYQWIALRELLGRLADNFHPVDRWTGDPAVYEGPWPWFGRDIDPSLATVKFRNDEYRSPIGRLPPKLGWVPGPPRERDVDESRLEWASDFNDFPDFGELLQPRDFDDGEWIALSRYSKWKHHSTRSTRWGWDDEQWLLQFAWLVQPTETNTLLETLGTVGLFGRWMPDRQRRGHRAYLGEGAWSPLDRAERAEWEEAREHYQSESTVMVLQATEEYLWEGNTEDCSIDETISFSVPIGLLLRSARWEGTEPKWYEGDRPIAEVLLADDDVATHEALLVHSAWLDTRLTELGLDLVVGTLGERQVMTDDGERILAWGEFSAAAKRSFGQSAWTRGTPLTRLRTPRG